MNEHILIMCISLVENKAIGSFILEYFLNEDLYKI